MRPGWAGAIVGLVAAIGPAAAAWGGSGRFTVHSARDGAWSDPGTWAEGRVPRAGDAVQVRAGHVVNYDVASGAAIRMVHVAGELSFARDRSTRLDVGLIRVDPDPMPGEDGFDCHVAGVGSGGTDVSPTPIPAGPRPALIIGTPDRPIPAGVTATIRLVHFRGTDPETLPAIVNCGGRWEVHGAPMSRTWVKLGATANPGDGRVTLSEPVRGWRVGDRVIVTASKQPPFNFDRTGKAAAANTEERLVAAIDGLDLELDRPLEREHLGSGEYRAEVANLSRNVVIESADPGGVRGHTMYHRRSRGGISYAEFRHLGKEGVLGKYPIHFHRVRDTMRGSGVLGASVWDSGNRWVTIHGTDYLLVRDCVGYRSVGHGFFLEDGTEQYNVLDRNLAVQAFEGRALPHQVLPYDENQGAGFWWANGRNTLTRNVSCENALYGFRFEISDRKRFNPALRLRMPDGSTRRVDVRTVPFFRFEGNESHGERIYSFYLGDEKNPSVRGDRRHPFIVRDLKAWGTAYAIRPNLQFFLAEGLNIYRASYGIYHPDYDAHVYRKVVLRDSPGEAINRGHDDESIQHGSFSYEDVLLENCGWRGAALIQLACTSPKPGQAGHFRDVVVKEEHASGGFLVDLGSGKRNPALQNGVTYYFHGMPEPGLCTKVVSAKFAHSLAGADYGTLDGVTGPDVRAAEVPDVRFPELLDPVDDLAPATMITSLRADGGRLLVRGVSHDNGEIASVVVGGRPARLLSDRAGVVDWEASLDPPPGGRVVARATDRAGNTEAPGDVMVLK